MDDAKHEGSCLCGAVRFAVRGALTPPTACHCSMCRKQSGHVWSSTEVPRTAVTIEGADRVTWFHATPKARRGFCSTCGSFLFWERPDSDQLEIGMGSFASPTGTHLVRHIFVANKGDYYEIADGLPQLPKGSPPG